MTGVKRPYASGTVKRRKTELTDTRLQVLFTATEAQAIRDEASKRGVSVAALIRDAALTPTRGDLMIDAARVSLHCPVCSGTDLGISGNDVTVKYRCKPCDFVFEITRAQLRRAGVYCPPSNRPHRTVRIAVHSSQFGSGR